MAWYANRKSGQVENLVSCLGWALVSLSGCNPPACALCRFNSCPTHFQEPTNVAARPETRMLRAGGERAHPDIENGPAFGNSQVVEPVYTQISEGWASKEA